MQTAPLLAASVSSAAELATNSFCHSRRNRWDVGTCFYINEPSREECRQFLTFNCIADAALKGSVHGRPDWPAWIASTYLAQPLNVEPIWHEAGSRTFLQSTTLDAPRQNWQSQTAAKVLSFIFTPTTEAANIGHRR
jgi:hypothetical protein